jgi:hypothetical protein
MAAPVESPVEDDVLDLPEPLPLPRQAEVAELPLPEPVRATAEPEPEPVRKPTLFERMMSLSRKPKAEEAGATAPVATLAPEPEEGTDDAVAMPPMPPFFRAQRN